MCPTLYFNNIYTNKKNILNSITKYKPLIRYFIIKYSLNNFIDIFNFIDRYINIIKTIKVYKDYEIFFKSTYLFYLSNYFSTYYIILILIIIYANFESRVKLYIN